MKSLLLSTTFTLIALYSTGQIIYVDASSTTSTLLGSSWNNAYPDLQDALTAASSGDSIWVAKGTYKPGISRVDNFEIKSGVKVYGGFAGTEPAGYNLVLRDFATNETILSGDIGTSGNSTDNSYNVVYTNNVSAATLLDGVTISDGNANGSTFPNSRGAGWANIGRNSGTSSPTIKNVIFKNNLVANKGAAICNDAYNNGTASPLIINCTFINNQTTGTTGVFGRGGAIFNEGVRGGDASPELRNCVFYNNTGREGASIYNDGRGQSGVAGKSNTIIRNCTFYKNGLPSTVGKEIYNNDTGAGQSNVEIYNSIFWGNSDSTIIFNEGTSTTTFDNCLFSQSDCSSLGDGTGTTSCDGTNIFGQDPLFIDSLGGDFRLQAGSPAINSGDNTNVIETFDMAGNLRINEGQVDIGAYETDYLDAIYYVDSAATGDGHGYTWTHAFTDLQDALSIAVAGDIIWIAEGTYKPTSFTDRNISFQIPDSVKVFGGFAGGEPITYDLDLRDFDTNKTVLSGDIGTLNDSTDNSYHVVYTENVSQETVVDGLTIKEGNANGSGSNEDGGGWHNDGSGSGNSSNPSLKNIVFTQNTAKFGGALFNYGSNGVSSPQLSNCTFTKNSAISNGGAMYNKGANDGNASPQLSNCTFTHNSANWGGALYNDGLGSVASPLLLNCTFTENTASKGGALFNNGLYGVSNPNVYNCTFTLNSSAIHFNGGAGNISSLLVNCVFNKNGDNHLNYLTGNANTQPSFINCTFTGAASSAIYIDEWNSMATPIDFTNCIFWDNNNTIVSDTSRVNINYSIVEDIAFTQGANSSKNNIHANPLFTNAATGDLSLSSSSPAINAGFNDSVMVGEDLAGNIRVRGGVVDMGAYEIQNSTAIVYVDRTKTTGANNGSDWTNAFSDLQDALSYSAPGNSIWVAKGTYKPTTTTNRTISFQIPDSIKVFGGFVGTEPSTYDLDLRDFDANKTVLSGDIGTLNNSTDNSYHVVYTKNVSLATLVDGLTIKEGNANGSSFNDFVGGGWYNAGFGSGNSSNPSLNNIVFTNNTAEYGGAIFNNGFGDGNASPHLSNCTFAENTANTDGGALYNNGISDGNASPQLSNCTFTLNTANSNGGVLFNSGHSGVSSPQLSNCTFTENTANKDGGAMYSYGYGGNASPQLSNCTFSENTANIDGGALYNNGQQGVSSPQLSNCTFSENTANTDGGAIYMSGDYGNISSLLVNCVFDSNGEDHIGYDDGNANTQPSFINCTFAGASSSAIYVKYWDSGETPIDFTNCIFWGNNDAIVDDTSHVNIQYSIVEDIGFTQGPNSSKNNTHADPSFKDAVGGDLSLSSSSPAIDQGTNAGIMHLTDITGQTHINAPDMGAYEYPCSSINSISITASMDNEYTSKVAINNIMASNKINPTSNVYYQASENILLEPGFEVEASSAGPTVFHAQIDACP